MAVPGHDQRDFEFANKFGLPIRAVVMPPQSWLQKMQVRQEDYAGRIGSLSEAFVDEGQGMQSENEDVSLDGLPTPEAKKAITRWLGESGLGTAAVKYKLRDWLFSRQRYWGEPIPILHELDADGKPSDLTAPVPDAELPVTLPEMEDFKPTGHPARTTGEGCLLVHTRVDGRQMRRETNTMPQWAGSCWYYLRFCDPGNETLAWDPAKERHWMPVDLYVGGAEHAVLHLLYARFWHKVLFDRGQGIDDGTFPAAHQPGHDPFDHLPHRRGADRPLHED